MYLGDAVASPSRSSGTRSPRPLVRLPGMASICPTCGKEVSGLDREVSFGLPDELFAIPEDLRDGHVFSDGKNFAHLDGKRFFMRVLLPVPLDIGHEYRFGVWMEVSEKDAQRVWQMWNEPGYVEAEVDGTLANAVPPWGARLLEAPCHASARNQNDVMFIDDSRNAELATILSTPWPVHECEQLIKKVWG